MTRNGTLLEPDTPVRLILHSLLLVASLVCGSALAQTAVTPGSYAFRDGVHPTFDFQFEGTDSRYVEAYWHDELRKMAMSTSTKREVVANGVVLPQVSPDTVRIQVKAEARKGAPFVTAHVAILTTSGYLRPGMEGDAYEAARTFVQRHSTALRRQLAQQELAQAQKRQAFLEQELATLQRDHERALASIEKSGQRAGEAAQRQLQLNDELKALEERLAEARTQQASEPSEEGAKDLERLVKEEGRLHNQLKKAQELETGMEERAKDLERTVQRNQEAQATKQGELDRQRALVEALREKLAGIE